MERKLFIQNQTKAFIIRQNQSTIIPCDDSLFIILHGGGFTTNWFTTIDLQQIGTVLVFLLQEAITNACF